MAKKPSKGRRTRQAESYSALSRGRFNGLTFGGRRDMYAALGYKTDLTLQDYDLRYRRNGIATRVVDLPALDTWRGGGEVVENADPETLTPFETEFLALDLRLKIWSALMRADRLSGIGQYAIVVLGAPGEMDKPLTKCSAEDIKYLSVYRQSEAPIQQFDQDYRSPRFGLPVTYSLKRTTSRQLSGTGSPAAFPGGIAKLCHYTRVIHVAELLDDRVYGVPRLERVWNYIDDLEKISGGGAEAFWRRADQGMQFDIDPTLDLDDDALNAMQEQVENYKHGLDRYMRTRGVKINPLGSDVADLKGPIEAVMGLICSSIGIPQRVFQGSEQGKLASDQDSLKYYRQMESRRADFAEPYVVRAFVDRLLELGALPQPADKVYDVRWSQLRVSDDDERANLAQKWAQVNSTAGLIIVKPSEIRERALEFEPVEGIDDQEMNVSQTEQAPNAPDIQESSEIRQAAKKSGYGVYVGSQQVAQYASRAGANHHARRARRMGHRAHVRAAAARMHEGSPVFRLLSLTQTEKECFAAQSEVTLRESVAATPNLDVLRAAMQVDPVRQNVLLEVHGQSEIVSDGVMLPEGTRYVMSEVVAEQDWTRVVLKEQR